MKKNKMTEQMFQNMDKQSKLKSRKHEKFLEIIEFSNLKNVVKM